MAAHHRGIKSLATVERHSPRCRRVCARRKSGKFGRDLPVNNQGALMAGVRGASGRRPAPAKLKLLNGRSPGRDSSGNLVKPPPPFERAAPAPPDWLSPEALAEWHRIVPTLDALGVLKEADRAMVSAYCETWSTYVTAIRQVRAEGVTVVNPETHCPRKNPALAAAEAAANQLRSLGNELGLSPAAERLLNIAPHADADDDDPLPGKAQDGRLRRYSNRYNNPVNFGGVRDCSRLFADVLKTV